MTKIPVRGTIAECYRFAGTRYLSVLGILWLPLLLYFVFSYFLVRNLAIHLVRHNVSSLHYAVHLLNFLFFAIVSAALVREVPSRRPNRSVVPLRFSGPELRVLASLVLLWLFVYATLMVLAILGGVLAAAIAIGAGHGVVSQNHPHPAFTRTFVYLVGAVFLISAIPAVFVGVRLGFFVAPVCVCENRFGLLRSWQLTRGNFWRCLAILVATGAPDFVLALAIFAIMYASGYAGGFPHNLARAWSDPQAFMRSAAGPTQKMLSIAPYFWPIDVLLAPVTIGLLLASGPIAYRGLGPDSANFNIGTDWS